jgi:SOS response regulatory protein OraA/RecX
MDQSRQEHWRWNVDPVWENYSGLVEEAWHSQNLQNDFARAQHLRSALTFAPTCLEAFLNRCMREWLEQRNTSEDQIYGKLRNAKFKEKLNDWPAEFCGRRPNIGVSAQRLFDLVADFLDLRNELIHPKAKDHSIYKRLDGLQPQELVSRVSEIIVSICEAKGTAYPYWILGWNFVGFNRDPTWPCVLPPSEFVHTMARMGFLKPSEALDSQASIAWQTRFLGSSRAFQELRAALRELPYDISPYVDFGWGPVHRLCKRWWDRDLILGSVPRC